MGNKEDEKAVELHNEVRKDSYEKLQYEQYEDEHVKQSVIHTRQDVVLLVSYASSIIKILKSIRFILGAILILFAIYFFFNL
tara:strand:- start:489 stop:734 length:246 start_codon:yes stop_codon:yes gene_type:complete